MNDPTQQKSRIPRRCVGSTMYLQFVNLRARRDRVARDMNRVARDAIRVAHEGGNLLLSGTVCTLLLQAQYSLSPWPQN